MLFSILYSIIVFSPLIGFGLSSILPKIYGTKKAVSSSIFFLFISFLFSMIIFFNNSIIINISHIFEYSIWISSGLFTCYWGFLFDTLTHIMLITITTISLLVHIYSSEYMSEDPHLPRFMSYLSLFTFFMLILVTANNFIQMFVGWEGVGFCSYLLINFWFTRLQANKAAIKAMLVNRVSDFTLILGILVLFFSLKTVEYTSVFNSIIILKDSQVNFFSYNFFIIDLICFFFFLGAMGKSAQLFLHVWLPDAMEGPTPVSALIHAATMVTAGIFLIARSSPIFEYSTCSLEFITIIGAITAFFASSVGLVQNDLKKIIAYSTCSQLGYMVFSCGLSNYSLGIFHLSNHAYFKALLFLSAGSVIHAMSDEQDIRKMGGLRRILPFTYSMFLIGSLALTGFPFLTGFYSKDVILEIAYGSYTVYGHFAYWLGTIAAFFTAFYSTRLLYFTFLSETNSSRIIILSSHDAPFKMAFPLGILAFYSIFIGYLSKDMFIGLGTSFFGNSLFILPMNIQLVDAEFLPIFYKLLPVILSIFSILLALFIFHYYYYEFLSYQMSPFGLKIYTFLNRKWYFDKIYNEYINQNLLKFGYVISYQIIDKGLIELFGPKGLSILIFDLGKQIINFQTGLVYNYSLTLFFSTLCFFFLIILSIFYPFFSPLFFYFILLYINISYLKINKK